MDSILPSSATRVGQTGFNVGHSALLILCCTQAEVVSFELDKGFGTQKKASITAGNNFVQMHFPGRHELILGRSQDTLKAYTGDRFEVFFIDGGHSYCCASEDIRNARKASIPRAIVLMDDVRDPPRHVWERGPTKAWLEGVRSGLIIQEGMQDGIAWGRFSHVQNLVVKEEIGSHGHSVTKQDPCLEEELKEVKQELGGGDVLTEVSTSTSLCPLTRRRDAELPRATVSAARETVSASSRETVSARQCPQTVSVSVESLLLLQPRSLASPRKRPRDAEPLPSFGVASLWPSSRRVAAPLPSEVAVAAPLLSEALSPQDIEVYLLVYV